MRSITRILSLGALTLGCQNEVNPPPPAPPCEGERCVVVPPRGGMMTGDSGGSTGGTTGAGTGGAAGDAGPAGRLAGKVFVLQNEDFESAAPFNGSGVIGASAPGGRVTANFTGDTYVLDGISTTSVIWVDLTPVNSTLDEVPTLLEVDPRDPSPDVTFVRAETIDTVGTNLLTPITIDPTRAQIVVRFVDAQGVTAPGVTVTQHIGDLVAYDIGGGIFQDTPEETTESGLAIVLNAPAVDVPGTRATFAFATGTRNGTFEVQIARGATSLVAVDVTQ